MQFAAVLGFVCVALAYAQGSHSDALPIEVVPAPPMPTYLIVLFTVAGLIALSIFFCVSYSCYLDCVKSAQNASGAQDPMSDDVSSALLEPQFSASDNTNTLELANGTRTSSS